MQGVIKYEDQASSALRNDYTAISELAKVSGEPIFITNKGRG